MKRFRATPLLRLFCASGLLLVSACSNPFSHSSNAIQNFHTPNTSCDAIDLSSNHLDENQLKSVVHCLNSNHLLQPLEDLVFSLPEKDLTSFSTWVNDTVDHNPQWLYAAKETYRYAESTSQLGDVEKLLVTLLDTPEKRTQMSLAIQAVAEPMAQAIVEEKPHLQTKNIYLLTQSKSYQRLIEENYNNDFLKKLVPSILQYLSQKDAFSLERLYRMIESHHLGKQYDAILEATPKKSIQNLAYFFSWIFDQKQYSTFSSSLHAIETQDIQCFDGKEKINNPLAAALHQLAGMNANEAKNYFKHDSKNLVLIAHGYCNIPYSLDPLLDLMATAADQPGFEEMFTLVKPLLADDELTQFLSSSASMTWVSQNQFLLQNHFFLDLFNILATTQKNDLTTNGVELAQLLDRSLSKLNSTNLLNLLQAFSPFFSAENKYGAVPMKPIFEIFNEFPTLKVTNQPLAKVEVEKMIVDALTSSYLQNVLGLMKDLIEQKKFNSIIDQAIEFFKSFLNRASIQIDFTKFEYPRPDLALGASWALAKLVPPPVTINDVCAHLSVDWNFENFSSNQSSAYLAQLSALQNCLNPNQTFISAEELARYAISKNTFSFLLNTQQSFLDHVLYFSAPLTFNTVDELMKFNATQLQALKSYSLNLSRFDQLSKDALLKLKFMRAFIADEVKSSILYQAASDWFKNPRSFITEPVVPSIDLPRLQKMDTFITKANFVENMDLNEAIHQEILQYCPTLDVQDKSCMLEDDQVLLYQESPAKLIEKIKTEYLESKQSWLHPNLFKAWNHTKETPTQISDFEYHLNPALHLLRMSPAPSAALVTSIKSMQDQGQDLNSFIKESAVHLTLIPYYYELPDYPTEGGREFSSRVRLRIVSDLDRLELMAINADFKPFGLIQNFGMNFVKEIALSWGDVPSASWPSTLAQYKNPVACDPHLVQGDNNCVRSLKQTQFFIEAELNKFDTQLIQRLGNCDMRGRTGLGRLLKRLICNNELSDLSARIFNLRFVISLLERELPTHDGGKNGLPILRTLFYSLYDSNTPSQRDNFPNGIRTAPVCLASPGKVDDEPAECAKDNLVIISKITRLGLLHEAGLSILKDQNSSTFSFLRLMNTVVKNGVFAEKFSKFISSAAGSATFESGVDFGFTVKKEIADDAASLMTLSSFADDQTWILSALDLVKDYPSLLTDYAPALEETLSDGFLNASSLNHYLSQTSHSNIQRWLNFSSSEFTHAVAMDASQGLKNLSSHQKDLVQMLIALKTAPEIRSPRLRENLGDWSTLLAGTSGENTRKQISDYVQSPKFDQFCDVFSDSQLVTHAYNFLESIHQNPDSSTFFQTCKEFLNVH